MRLTYQTGIAALIHLGIITVLNVANGVTSSVQQCTNGSTDCIGNIITSLLYFIAITIWFTAIWILASATQVARSRKLAFLLIGAEFLVAVISLFNARHHNNWLGLATSLVDALLAVWVGFLASRLLIAGNSRVTTSRRSRQRRLSN